MNHHHIEAMRQALEALEYEASRGNDDAYRIEREALRTAIAFEESRVAEAEKQEPFGYFQYAPHFDAWVQNRDENKGVAFYTTPPAAQRQPLTDEKIWLEYQRFWPFHPAEEPRRAKDIAKFARAIEAAHGIKGDA